MADYILGRRKAPIEVQVDDNTVLLFRPEVMGDEMTDGLMGLAKFALTIPTDDTTESEAALDKASEATTEGRAKARAFIGTLLLNDEQRSMFDNVELPDPLIAELLDFLKMEYLARPTGPSTGSQAGSLAESPRSTQRSRSTGSTRKR